MTTLRPVSIVSAAILAGAVFVACGSSSGNSGGGATCSYDNASGTFAVECINV